MKRFYTGFFEECAVLKKDGRYLLSKNMSGYRMPLAFYFFNII